MSEPLHARVLAAIGQQYELHDEIGRGGMSVVYRARDLRLNRAVAIKVLPPELAYDPAIRTRFTREAQTSGALAHPHIVPIFDVGDREGIAYFVMAFVNGGNLASLLAREPRQPIDEVRRLAAQIADALGYAHLHGVIHRDVKPDNVLLDGHTGRAMVTDFGIARAIESGTRLTITGNAVGTPTYMSPEQALGEREVDGRSDIYSLGVLAYQMLTGRVPFSGGNSLSLLLKHVSELPRPIVELRPETPRSLRDTIERALAKSPDDRWPTAAALREALMAEEGSSSPSWRAEHRESVRYTSPRPASGRRDRMARTDVRTSSPPRGSPAAGRSAVAPATPARGEVVLEPPHLATLTDEQRADLRLWHGRVNLIDRIRTMRRYAWATVVAAIAGGGALVGAAEMPPFIVAPIVPIYMAVKSWRRGKSLRASGLRLRRVLFMPRAKLVIPAPPTPPRNRQLEKVASREILESPQGAAVRRAVEERSAILATLRKLSKADRALLPDLEPAVNGLVERVVHLAQTIHELDQSFDPQAIEELDARVGEAESDESPDGQRRVALLRRQRSTLEELVRRRAVLLRQLDSAGLALVNLRLDLVKLQSSGLQSALSDVSSATQEARALSREIGVALDAAAEVKSL